MKRLALAGTVTLTTFVLGIFAVAVAQRDARNRSEEVLSRPEYSLQSPVPISARLSRDDEVITASDQGVPPLDVPPPLSSKTVVRANDEGTSLSNSLRNRMGTSTPNPQMMSPPSLSSTGPSQSLIAAPNNASGATPQFAPSFSSANAISPPSFAPTATITSSGDPASNPNGLSNAQSIHRNVASDSTTLVSPTLTNPPSGNPTMPTLGNQGMPNPIATNPSLGSPSLGSPSLGSPAYVNSPTGTPSNGVPPFGSPLGSQSQSAESPNTATQSGPSAFTNPNRPTSSINGSAANALSNPNQGSTYGASNGSNGQLSSTPSGTARVTASPSSFTSSNPNVSSGMQSLQRGSTSGMSENGFRHLVTEKPGQRGLDGAQNPSLSLQKRAPEEVQVGQPATFTLIVRNVGNATAHEVTVIDRVPSGTRLSRSQPNVEPDRNGNLVWSLGEMIAGAEQTIVLELIPETEGEIGSTASVTFASQASVRTVSTQPRLEITQVLDPKVLIGNMLDIRIQISNNGTGVARDIVLVEEVPTGLKHPKGPSMELEAFNLEPGESRTIPLELLATEAGMLQNIVRATAANTSPVETVSSVQVVAPKLQVALVGPKLRYLERQATYQITIANPGTAVARNVDIMASLPRGLRFNNAGEQGEYISSKHAVAWNLEELGPGESASTELVVLPVEEGDFVIRVQTQAQDVRPESVEKQVRVEGQSELAFSIEDDNDPIETDGFTTYTVKINNIGTRGDRNVEVAVELPPGATVLQVKAPMAHKTTSNGILFEPIPEMRAKDQQVIQFSVRLSREETQVVRAQVKSQQRPVPVVKEESTQVYSDK